MPNRSSASQREEFARRSARAEVALALRVGERTAERLIGEAEALVQVVPVALEAVERGAVSWQAACTIAGEAATLSTELRNEQCDAAIVAGTLAQFEAGAIELARRVPPSRLRNRLETLRERLHPVLADVRHETARAERHVVIEDLPDGMSWLHALLPAVEAHAVMHRLSDVARASRDLDAEERAVDSAAVNGGLCTHQDQRTLDQRRADLLVDFITGSGVRVGDDPVQSGAGGREFERFAGIRPTVVVTIPVQTMLPQTDGPPSATEPAMLDGIVPIDPETARQLAGRATSFYRLLVDPHTGARLDLSRNRYQVTPELRMWLRLRDEHCRFPGCGRLVKGADIDHTIDWQHGGPTRADNLAHLCRGHHTLKHQTRWQVSQAKDGTLTWRAPSSTVHATAPPGAFARGG